MRVRMMPEEYASWVRLSGVAISLAVAVIFVGALISDYGFYTAFNLSYKNLPTSLGDHFRSSLNFIQFAIPATVGVLFVWMIPFLAALRKGGDPNPTMKSTVIIKFFIRCSALIFFPAFPVVVYMFQGDDTKNLSIISLVPIVFGSFMLVSNFMFGMIPARYYTPFIALVIGTGFYMHGRGDAVRYVDGSSQVQLVHTVKYSPDLRTEILHAYVLKYFERGILVCEVRNRKNGLKMDCQENIIFLPWEKIIKVRIKRKDDVS